MITRFSLTEGKPLPGFVLPVFKPRSFIEMSRNKCQKERIVKCVGTPTVVFKLYDGDTAGNINSIELNISYAIHRRLRAVKLASTAQI
jgi:hypothetical protein